MSAVASSRALLRRRPFFTPRHAGQLRPASTAEKAGEAASNASSKAKETASNFQSKASEGLSRVTSSAGPAISGVAKSVSSALGKIGGRTGRLVQAIEARVPPTIYYSRVGLELGKLVFQGQKMALPSLESFQSSFQPILSAARHPSSILSSTTLTSSESILSRIRNVSRAQLAAAGVVTAEILGFFTVGEMLGKMKIVGYRGESHHDH